MSGRHRSIPHRTMHVQTAFRIIAATIVAMVVVMSLAILAGFTTTSSRPPVRGVQVDRSAAPSHSVVDRGGVVEQLGSSDATLQTSRKTR